MRPPTPVPAAPFSSRGNVVHRFKNVGGITGRTLGWSLPGGQDHYLKAISELAAGGGFTSEKVMEISKTFDTHFPPFVHTDVLAPPSPRQSAFRPAHQSLRLPARAPEGRSRRLWWYV